MKLESKFDAKSLRKKQQKAQRPFNIVGRFMEKLALPKDKYDTIHAVLTSHYDWVMGEIFQGREVAGLTDVPDKKKEEEPAAAGGGFV